MLDKPISCGYCYLNRYIQRKDGYIMDIYINKASEIPLYEQIAEQIKQLIINGSLHGGTHLPSVRALAQSLGISVITTRRAYTELEREGYVITTPAKGTFVAMNYKQKLRDIGIDKMTDMIDDLIYLSLALDINREQLINLVEEYYDYIHLHHNGNAKLHQVLKRKSLPKEIETYILNELDHSH